jgi:transcription elongation factor GreA-like protein/transcription elongation GreA/GreB family factor
MTYVEEIRSKVASRDYNKIMVLWQEYCENDELDSVELIEILHILKQSDFAKQFGQYVEAILPLVMTVADDALRFEVLKAVYDVQTSNSQPLYELSLELIKTRFSKDPLFQEKMRLVGLRSKENFQGVLSNFLLLNHVAKGNYVLHTGGWGVGEIVDFSFLREQVTVTFENLGGGRRDISFKSAFRSLVPLQLGHFYVQRFIAPEKLAQQAKEDPVDFVLHILRDTGPKTPAEIKELVVDHIMDVSQYSKWWQIARGRIKKDGRIDVPINPRDPLLLRKEVLSPVGRLEKALEGKYEFADLLNALYITVRDFPELARKKETAEKIEEIAQNLVTMEGIRDGDRLEVYFFVEQMLGDDKYAKAIKDMVQGLVNLPKICSEMSIIALRKCLLQAVRVYRKDWEKLFAESLLLVDPVQIKDYLLKELLSLPSHSIVESRLRELVEHPALYPEALLWYFQKETSDDAPLMNSQKDKDRFFESFLLLMSTMERKKDEREFVKKMYSILTGNRFQIVRDFLKNTDEVYAREFLLLASKCNSLTRHDQNILKSLVDVVHKEAGIQHAAIDDSAVVWTTEDAYLRAKDRILHMGTVDVVENAKEIESARAHGDLRENAEYKAALEKRTRLQIELKQLSDQFNHARIITPADISTDYVGIGSRVTLKKKSGGEVSYTILGPWDADVEKNILSRQSKLAQTLIGKEIGNSFEFLGEPVTVTKIESYV